MKKLYSFLFILLYTTTVIAQHNSTGSIMGNVMEAASGKAVSAASIIITSVSDSSKKQIAITDKSGSFVLKQVPYGYYRLKISFAGYNNYVVDSIRLYAGKEEVVLNDLSLKPSTANTLNEVIVYAEKKLYDNKDGVLTYNVSESPLSNGSSASDMLKNVPLVNANPDGSLTVKGKPPLILIDEKPTNLNAQQLSDLLESLPANVIEKVEVMQTPPPEYATYDGSVINIVTKKGRVGLYQRYAVSGGTKGEGSISSSINYKSAGFSFSGNLGIGAAQNYGNSWSHRENIYKDSINYFYTQSNYYNKNWYPNLRLQTDMDLNKQTSVGLVYQGYTGFYNNTSNAQYTNLSSNYTIWKASNRNTYYDGNSYSHGVSGYYQWKGKNPAEKIQVYSGINLGKNANDKDFYQQYLLNNLLPSGLDSTQTQYADNYSTAYYLRGNYNKPLNDAGNTLFTTGTSFTQNNYHNILNSNYFNRADSNFHLNDLLSNNFFFYQSIFTVRAGMVISLPAQWRLIFGAQAEFTNASFKFVKGNAVDANNSYWRILPNITLRKEFSRQFNTSITFRETIRRPGIVELNPSVDYTDPYNIRFGNPYVQPALTQNFDFNLSYSEAKFNINTGFGYNKIKDVFSSVRTLITAGKTQTTYQNISDQDEYHASLWSGITVTRKFRLNISSGINYNSYSDIEKLLYHYEDGGSYYAGLNYSYMPDNITVFEAANRYNNFSNPQGKTHSNISMTLSAQRKFFNKKLVVNLTAIDPLGLTKYESYTAGTNFIINSFSQSNTQNFRLTLSYQINKTFLRGSRNGNGDVYENLKSKMN
jgi:ferric enterobactin receptor